MKLVLHLRPEGFLLRLVSYVLEVTITGRISGRLCSSLAAVQYLERNAFSKLMETRALIGCTGFQPMPDRNLCVAQAQKKKRKRLCLQLNPKNKTGSSDEMQQTNFLSCDPITFQQRKF